MERSENEWSKVRKRKEERERYIKRKKDKRKYGVDWRERERG